MVSKYFSMNSARPVARMTVPWGSSTAAGQAAKRSQTLLLLR